MIAYLHSAVLQWDLSESRFWFLRNFSDRFLLTAFGPALLYREN